MNHLIIGGTDSRWVREMLAEGRADAVRKHLTAIGYSAPEVDETLRFFETKRET
jgi:hypothetical protein